MSEKRMTGKAMSTESAYPNIDHERMLKYWALAAAFVYPDDNFFSIFEDLNLEREVLILEYDRLFRAAEIWLYGAEYTADNEFQRVKDLADIMAFYRAFGVEPQGERPDALASELEFMHYLIFKRRHALQEKKTPQAHDNAALCVEAQQKFFMKHLCPAAKKIGLAIISLSEDNFYTETAREMLEFIESEKTLLEGTP